MGERQPIRKIGILCAGDREAEPVAAMLNQTKTIDRAMLTFREGKIENVQAVVLYSGVCKVNAAIAAQILADRLDCDAIINAGTAGAIAPEVQLFDTIVSAEAAYHDVADEILTEFHPWLKTPCFQADPDLMTLARAAAQRMPDGHRTLFGRMVTGEQFVQEDQKQRIRSAFDPLSADMETAAVAHVCYVNRIPFIAVRTITDTADHSGADDFEKNCAKAAQITAAFVRKMLLASQRRV